MKQGILRIILFLLIGVSSITQAADVYIGLSAYTSNGKALGVGLPQFTGTSPDAEKLRAVLREDLLFSKYFNLVEGGPALLGGKLDSVAWGSLGAQVVVTGEVKLEGTKVSLECKIIDAGSGKILFAKVGDSSRDASRRLAHLVADQLIFQLSGQPGIAHTRITFVNNKSRHKEIYVMDYDGANIIQLSFDRSIALLPKWSPDGRSIAFTSYRAQNPDAYLLDFPGAAIHQLSMRQGLNTGPHWSPDGKQLTVTLSKGGDPDLYLLDTTGRILRRLTYVAGVDTSGTFSPNGQQIAFVSDRSGNPELYVMDITGANVQRLTYGQQVDAPAWSPKGDVIVYQRQRNQGQHDIYTIDPSGRNNQVLTQGGARNESPTWSPDGRFIVFASNRNGRRQIFVMAADGSDPHPIGDIAGESSDPSWGP